MEMKDHEAMSLLCDFARLVGFIADIEAVSLDIRDLLKRMPPEGRADVGDELQQVADLSRTIAEKLEISEQVDAIRAMHEAKLQGDRALRASYDAAIKAFCALGKDRDGEEG